MQFKWVINCKAKQNSDKSWHFITVLIDSPVWRNSCICIKWFRMNLRNKFIWCLNGKKLAMGTVNNIFSLGHLYLCWIPLELIFTYFVSLMFIFGYVLPCLISSSYIKWYILVRIFLYDNDSFIPLLQKKMHVRYFWIQIFTFLSHEIILSKYF